MRLTPYPFLSEAIQSLYGNYVTVTGRQRVSGGDCNDAYCLTLSDGQRLFMKSNDIQNTSFFRAEADGLSAIRDTGQIRTPGVLAYGTDRESNTAFLLLEYIDQSAKGKNFFETFGQSLANMHRADTAQLVPGGMRFGFYEDNIIGFRPQINTPHGDWISFYRDCRIAPQVKDAVAAGLLPAEEERKAATLMEKLDRYLIEPEKSSLVHGDLWGGNYMTGEDGSPVIIDPAVYVGHREADLAMSQMFGGFPAAFYRSYAEAFPIEPGYEDRRPLYDLYQMLNNLNQFGRTYLPAVQRILARYA